MISPNSAIKEHLLTDALGSFMEDCNKNCLKPNRSKPQVPVFHLRNKEDYRKLKVEWEGVEIKHTYNSKYFGITLNRALTYKKHCINTKQKVHARTTTSGVNSNENSIDSCEM